MTPSSRVIGWAAVCIGIVLVVFALVNGWNDLARSIPFTSQWRAARAEKALERTESYLSARMIEAEAQREQIVRIESAGRLHLDLSQVSAEAVSNARNATDANQPLEAGLAARLRDNDRRLCELRPAACAAPADPAATGD